MTLVHQAVPSLQLAVNLVDAQSLLAAFGTLGIAVAMFAEAGLLIGFFLPGDSPLFIAGLLRASGSTGASGRLSLGWVLVATATVGLVMAGYGLGASVPNVDRYFLPIIAVIVVVSLIPVGLELVRSRRSYAANGAA
ncbi:hypothetical protein ACFV1A_28380 [Streptomyces seoulensis]|uniref:DedA family protein n=1 Tax=Streptomyces seoulensis TaxID=73044 RepID=A0A4P6TRA4_STRSO|nr:hypothetical protein [Streptomyces seoulensis]QBJ89103.1 hypothetical protein D0Z67_01390 [Streptomyces seoulensis]